MTDVVDKKKTTTSIVKPEAATTVAKSEKSVYATYGAAMNNRNFIGTLLSFNKGDYLAGREDELIPLGTRFAAAMDTIKTGWVRWEDGVAVEHWMELLIEGRPPKMRSELGFTDKSQWPCDKDGKSKDPVQFTNYLVLKREDDGRLFTFTTATKGGLGAIGKLCEQYDAKILRKEPDKDPIIKIGSSSYEHSDRSIGRVKYPTFELVGSTDKVVIDE
jgi:hypothetical protein